MRGLVKTITFFRASRLLRTSPNWSSQPWPTRMSWVRSPRWTVMLSNEDMASGRVLVLLLADDRGLFALDDRAVHRDVRDVFAARDFIHDVEHDLLEHGAQGAGAGALFHGLAGEGAQGVPGDGEVYAF